jgi:hypothetical protein
MLKERVNSINPMSLAKLTPVLNQYKAFIGLLILHGSRTGRFSSSKSNPARIITHLGYPRYSIQSNNRSNPTRTIAPHMHSSPAIVESYHPGRRSGHARPAQGRPKTGSDRQIHGRKKKGGVGYFTDDARSGAGASQRHRRWMDRPG